MIAKRILVILSIFLIVPVVGYIIYSLALGEWNYNLWKPLVRTLFFWHNLVSIILFVWVYIYEIRRGE